MKIDGISDDLQQRMAALLQEGSSAFAGVGIRPDDLEALRSWYREISLARLSMDVERQRYRELLEVVSHGYLITDPDGVIREANDGVAALMDVHPELLLGRSLLDFVAEDGRQDLRERIKHFLQVDGGSVQQWQSTLQPPGQAASPPLSSSSPGETPKGKRPTSTGYSMT
jgi:PAS domain S-box-containing protein